MTRKEALGLAFHNCTNFLEARIEMKVTFDSNVWRWVVDPDATPNSEEKSVYRQLHELCLKGVIFGHLSVSMFAWEAVNRLDRKSILEKDAALTIRKPLKEKDGCFFQVIEIGPDRTIHPGTPEKFMYYLSKARSLGFKLMRIPRLGYLYNRDIADDDDEIWAPHDEDMSKYFSECVRVIEELGGGMSQLRAFGGPSIGLGWLEKIKLASPDKAKFIAKAVAEWADGDSVAAHLAYKNDLFCTKDNGRGAGAHSVMHPENASTLARHFGFKKVSPVEALAYFL